MINKFIEEKAENLLKEHNLFKAPVNIQNLAKKLGINIEAAKLESEISGFLVIKDQKAFIRYNESENKKRNRFTIAHELGHFILHSNQQPLFIDKANVMYRNPDSASGELTKEREANAFAAALLMPKRLISSELEKIKEGDKISLLAKRFRVNPQAMSFRLSNLGYDFGII